MKQQPINQPEADVIDKRHCDWNLNNCRYNSCLFRLTEINKVSNRVEGLGEIARTIITLISVVESYF